jgi:hypothetical protein
MEDCATFMRSLDARFRAKSQLDERRFYSIFYSQINPSPVLILGLNPGGDPENWDQSSLASQAFYENGEHEYVDCDYPIAVAMRTFLQRALSLPSEAAIRGLPKTNVIFRRSRNLNSLGVPVAQAMDEALPFVEEIIFRVQPTAVILEGIDTLSRFARHYCSGVPQDITGREISTPNGRHRARIFQASRGQVRCLAREALLIGIGHPSKYAGRTEWSAVVSRTKALLKEVSDDVQHTASAEKHHSP